MNTLASRLRSINYAALPISDYNKQYIARLLPVLEYYLGIYDHCLRKVLEHTGKSADQLTLVDYGGGHGFLSIYAKQLGFQQVVYVDLNPNSVHTAEVLTEQLCCGPDVLLQGGSQELSRWCQEQGEHPDALLGMDVIEHVYCLDDFFSDLCTLPVAPYMLFTTASTPFNPWVKRRLHKAMDDDERGHTLPQNYLSLRYEYIRDAFPQMSDAEVRRWAEQTRGLIYADIARAVEAEDPNLLSDPHNTCDPRTGNWTERILPISDYQSILQPYGYGMSYTLGWYNTRHPFPKSLVARFLNRHISRRTAPFLIFEMLKTKA